MFKIGQKVVCVEPSPTLVKNEIYTITWVGECRVTGALGVRVKEAEPRPQFLNFNYWRFREIDVDWVDEVLEKVVESIEQTELIDTL